MADHNGKYNILMLIDDNEIDNLINNRIIESSEICNYIFTHTSGKSAIEYLKNAEKLISKIGILNGLPEVIFLDIDMPLMDGFQFLDEYEKLPKTILEFCKIVILTSSINSKDVKKSKDYSFVKEFINKPLSKENLKGLSI
jgi:CheY-like chemotaxis protein